MNPTKAAILWEVLVEYLKWTRPHAQLDSRLGFLVVVGVVVVACNTPLVLESR